MSAEFSIEAEPARDLIRIRMSGFFTEPDILAFLAARRAAHAELRCAANQHVTLNDVRDMKIQSQDMVESFRAMLSDPLYRSRRLAFVVGPTLTRTQLIRAISARDAKCFEDVWAAEAWLRLDAARAA
ncbi:MAG: hypothetical protein EOP62_19800 [Sphingomonadales bacterium]|nr:MAG: hypothetical protein EOP62_19800 [Sphingomonadales bacterium]